MIAVDTNVLVFAHRAGLPGHERALAWLRHLAEGNVPWGIPVFCLGEFVRVTTHPRVLDPPSTLDEALAALDGLLKCPTVRVLNPGPSYPALFGEALRRGDARGNLAFDAQINAVCREQGASRLLTLDRDFARFPGVGIVTLEEPPP
ncbi:MAG: TA system VapC family ribonuclease toxin [Gemmatimonadota bacterium]